MCKYVVKKLPFAMSYICDWYKTQQIYDKATLENGGTLESIPDYYKNQKMCDKGIYNNPHALKFVPDCYKTQEMCNKAVKRCFLAFIYIDEYLIQFW